MDPNATPRIHVRERSPTPPPANSKILMFEFEVEDTGPGIPEHLQQQVFEPFVQGDLGLSKKFGGTGLGLSICSQLAGLMGGEIDLESTVGTGTTFSMKIPLKFVKERAASTTSSDAINSRPPSVTNPSDKALTTGSVLGDTPSRSTASVTISSNSPADVGKDPQPRLVGLSQPFFASPPSPSIGDNSKERLAILDQMAKAKGSQDKNKVRVLVAEDNLVNQEVVLR